MDRKSLKQSVIETFEEYGGQWELGRMAEWLGVSEKSLDKAWKELEKEGILERKKYGTNEWV